MIRDIKVAQDSLFKSCGFSISEGPPSRNFKERKLRYLALYHLARENLWSITRRLTVAAGCA
jgi:hypothetical protein